MRVFVTGASGVLGRRVLPMLQAAGHGVTAVVHHRPAPLGPTGAVPVEVDLFDSSAVASAVEGHDVVLDLATRIPPTNRMILGRAWRENSRLRSVAAANISEAAGAGGSRYVRESVGLVYADGGDRWLGEDAPLDPLVHTRSALDAEAAASRVTAAGGVGVALRFALLYGPDSPHTRDQIRTAHQGIATVFGDPDGYLPQVHLDDGARAVVAALDAPAGVYNVVEDEPLRRDEFVDVLAGIAGRRLRTPPGILTVSGPAKAMARSLRLDNSRLREMTGWKPTHTSARHGLPAVVAERRRTTQVSA